MRTPFIRVRFPPKDDSREPQPTPIPIRIVSEASGQRQTSSDETNVESTLVKKPNDYVYDAWDRFLCKMPNRKSTAAKKIDEEKKIVEQTPGDGLQKEENVYSSWEQAASECRAKVAAIVEECNRLNQKYRDAMFDLDADGYCFRSLDGRDPKASAELEPPPESKRVSDIFDNPQFFIDGATATDVHQGSGGDCWFLAALMAVSTKRKELIEETLCVAKDEKVGVYGFVFFKDGEWIYEVIDDKLYLRVGDADDLELVRDWNIDLKDGMPIKHDKAKLKTQLQKGGEALYFSHCKSNETWVPLVEKAYAKVHGDYFTIEGGNTSEAIEDLTGGVGVVLNPEDIMDKERFWREELSQVNEKYLFGGGSKRDTAKGVIGNHAYAVLKAYEEGDVKLLKLRNPWGESEWIGDWSDGSKFWTSEMLKTLNHQFGDDGIFWISYQDFLKHFQNINRVRLFSNEWQMAQCWTCVNVPWAVDYLDTKFQFSITQKCSVVIVLSQPDDRYFRPLSGRYDCALHFRVFKDDNPKGKWLVRSMHNSGSERTYTRSVSAEIENLEPGTYNVEVKVTAQRGSKAATAEDIIMKYAIDRKEKLLAVGRRFDYAQSKGNLRAMEESNKRRERQEGKDLQKSMLKKERKFNKLEKGRERRRKQRVNEVMKEKRKEFREKEKQRAMARAKKHQEQNERASPVADADIGAEKTGQSPVDAGPSPVDTDQSPVDSAPADGESEQKEEAKTTLVDSKPTAKEPEADRETQDNEAETLSKDMERMKLIKTPTSSDAPDGPPEDDDYESPEPPEELDDDDFDWDSEIDDPVNTSDDDELPALRAAIKKNTMFVDDPWNAMCVLGLRVYSLNGTAKVSVIKGENSS